MTRLESLYVDVIDRVSEDESMFTTRSREGIFSPALTMWLMINGWAKGRRGLSAALDAITAEDASEVIALNNKTKRVRVTEVSMNSGGLSRARQRLEGEKLRALVSRMNEVLISEVHEHLWHGRRVYLFDGTVIPLIRTEATFGKFRPVRNQHRQAYTPVMLCGVCHELFSGIALSPRHGAYRGAEQTDEVRLCCEMIEDLPSQSLLIADRGLGIFPVAYEATRQKHHVLVRLTSTRAKLLSGKNFHTAEYIDQAVTWKMKNTTRLTHLNIPADATVTGRFIKWTVKRNGYRPLELFFFTTSSESAEELVALYQQRERIENDIRTLKYTIGMERLFSKTPAMIAQELLLGVLAYNLIRVIIAQAARELKLQSRQISFTRAARNIQIFGNKMRDAKGSAELKALREHFLRILRQTRIPDRGGQRIEPRKLTREKQPYPPLKESRKIEKEKAKAILAENGHRGYFTSVTRNY